MSTSDYCKICGNVFEDAGKIQNCVYDYYYCKICTNCACMCLKCLKKKCEHGIFYFSPGDVCLSPCNECIRIFSILKK